MFASPTLLPPLDFPSFLIKYFSSNKILHFFLLIESEVEEKKNGHKSELIYSIARYFSIIKISAFLSTVVPVVMLIQLSFWCSFIAFLVFSCTSCAFKFVEYPYKDSKKNEIIFREFETACQQSSVCSPKKGIENLHCVRECISPGCYANIYKHDEVAMVEVNLNQDSKVPPAMLIAFTVCTTLLVGVHMLALMISTCILPNIDAVCSMNNVNLVHESPHERLHWYIETAWAFSTLLGLILFLFEIAILCWVKFYEISQVAAWSACAVLIPVLVVFVAFAVHFYHTMVAHKYEVSRYGIRELELLKEQIEVNDSSNAHSPNSTIEVTSNYSRTQIV